MIVILLLCFGLRAEGVITADTWFNLRFGRSILSTGFPHTNVDTITGFGHIWIDVQWLAHVFWSVIYAAFRDTGVVIVRALLMIAALVIPIWSDRSQSLRPALTSLLSAVVAAPFFAARAQSLAEVYASVALLLLRSPLTHRTRGALVALALLWANTHGSAPLLPAMVALLIVVDERDRPANILLFLLTLACLPITPYGFATITHFKGTLLNPLLRRWVEEWSFASIRETPGFFLVFALFVVIGVRAKAWQLREERFGFLLCCITATLGFWANRYQVFFALSFAHFANQWVHRTLGKSLPFSVPSFRLGPSVAVTALSTVLAVVLAKRAETMRASDGFDQGVVLVREAITKQQRIFVDLALADRLLFVAPDCAGQVPFDVRLELWDESAFALNYRLERDRSAVGLTRWERYDLLWLQRREEYGWQLRELARSPRWNLRSTTRIGKVFSIVASRDSHQPAP